MPLGIKLPSFNKFTGKVDPEEHIDEFQSQMAFQHPCSKVYYRGFPSTLVGPTVNWFNQLLEGCITSFEELKRREGREKGGEGGWKSSHGGYLPAEPQSEAAEHPGQDLGPRQKYALADLPRGSAFSCLQWDLRKKKEVKEWKIEYLTPLNASAGNVFIEIEDKQMLP
ncbi:hypothetical protein LIER_21498 [Lithospermum erythrorhizon]|uniref:Reverse transcriptase domain-containing protein n=1 Tax=Lithospermum erythrorhizon TaxID=34254 RepID=A0AAV3QRZ4_LITER